MPNLDFKHALIVGAGAGLSASLARLLAQDGLSVSLAARSTDDLAPLVQQTGARAFACDASKHSEVERLFGELDAAPGAPDIVIYNASFRTRGPLIELNPADVERSLAVTAFGAFLVAQQAARRMLPMTPRVYSLLRARHEACGRPSDGWIFPCISSTWKFKNERAAKCVHFNGDAAKEPRKLWLIRV